MLKIKMRNTHNIFYLILWISLSFLVMLLVLGPWSQLRVITDDYYYYQRIASNILLGQGVTYSGLVPTNGFQPLWALFVMASVKMATFLPATDSFFAIAFNLAFFISGLYLIQKKYVSKINGYHIALLLLLASYALYFSPLGMEVGVIFFLACLLLPHLLTDHALDKKGTLLMLLSFLGRIDCGLYYCPFVLYALLTQRKKWFFMATGFCFLMAYFFVNYHYVGAVFPVSGLAKTIIHYENYRFHSVTSLFDSKWTQGTLIWLGVLTCYTLLYGPRDQRKYIYFSLSGVFLYFFTTFARSDWPLWPWYTFPFAFHAVLLSTVASSIQKKSTLNTVLIIGSSLIFLLTGAYKVKEACHVKNTIFDRATELQAFFNDKPDAIVAMGDQAGALGRLIPNKLVQMEGLVMDQGFLSRMRTSKKIEDVFKYYGVNYYVATYPEEKENGCYFVREPRMSAGYSIKFEDTICFPVVARFGYGHTDNPIKTIVFKVL